MARSNVVIPYGVPFESLYVLFIQEKKFFDFIFWACNRPFLTPVFFYVTDGGGGWWIVDGG